MTTYMLVTSHKLARVKRYYKGYIDALKGLDEVIGYSKAFGELTNQDLEDSVFMASIPTDIYKDGRKAFTKDAGGLCMPEYYQRLLEKNQIREET